MKKISPLTGKDKQIIKEHTIYAVKVLEPIGMFDMRSQVIKYHHENFDGNGYPEGLK